MYALKAMHAHGRLFFRVVLVVVVVMDVSTRSSTKPTLQTWLIACVNIIEGIDEECCGRPSVWTKLGCETWSVSVFVYRAPQATVLLELIQQSV